MQKLRAWCRDADLAADLGQHGAELAAELVVFHYHACPAGIMPHGRLGSLGQCLKAGGRRARHGQDPAYLYTGSLLEAAAAAAARAYADPGRRQPLDPGERAFLAASSRARRRRARRLQGLLAVLTALTVALTAATITALSQRATANTERNQAIENQLEAEAGLLSATSPSLTAQLLLTACHMDPQSRDLAWQLISTESQPLSTSETTGNGGAVISVAFSPDGKTLAAGDYSGDNGDGVQIWDRDVHYAISRICDQTAGVLTPQQWSQYIPQLQYVKLPVSCRKVGMHTLVPQAVYRQAADRS